jgi:hypothetical protein
MLAPFLFIENRDSRQGQQSGQGKGQNNKGKRGPRSRSNSPDGKKVARQDK